MNPTNTAPKDSQFLGDFGWPQLNMTHWNEASRKWAYANYQVGLYEGGWTDSYYETELESEHLLRGWLPLPTIPQPITNQPTCTECGKPVLSLDGTMDDTHMRCYPTTNQP